MDFIILNSDGSLQKQSLTRYIQQGSHGVDEIFIGWVNATSSQTLQAVFTLPNQLTNTELGTFESNYEYEPGETMSGWVITLTENQTRYNGALMVSARIILNGIVQVAYPFALIINETGVMPENDSGITLAQLDSYLLNIQNLVTDAVRQNTDAFLSSTSENPVQNKVITNAFDTLKRGSYTKVNTTEYPTLQDFLATTGEEGFLYLYPVNTSNEDEGYYQYIWENNLWIPLGTTKIDIANMVTTDTEQTISGSKTFTTTLNAPNKITFPTNRNNWYIEDTGSTLVFRAGGNSIWCQATYVPYNTNTFDLGTSTRNWKDLYLSNQIILNSENSQAIKIGTSGSNGGSIGVGSGGLYIVSNNNMLGINCNVRPYITNNYDLGSPTFAWKGLFLSEKITIKDQATTPHEWIIGSKDNYYLGFGVGGNLLIYFNPTGTFFTRDLEPLGNNGFTLGTSSKTYSTTYTQNISDGTNSVSVADIAKKVDATDNYDVGAFDSNGEITVDIGTFEQNIELLGWGQTLHGMYMLTYSYAQAIIYLDKNQLETAGGYGIGVRTAMPVVYNLTGSAEPGNLIIKKVGSNYVFKVSNGVQKAAATLHLYMIKTDLVK